ncbi:MAG: hypothetical protein WC769_02395 [Thermodesulfovibrionales bacterium]|jgi:hypothetical protein
MRGALVKRNVTLVIIAVIFMAGIHFIRRKNPCRGYDNREGE